ncbi:hypothetical protein [Herbiconiux sp. L3-i23]|uniref:hypothetical protein n=1 Tax=Herbiconiux sp. L3-i23 TaxID=2905871 RepID=UPI00206DF165|nr:hypothetical protein [Herbiconiux sp. L3-i23]BDI21296.1 hypothetical protein L3i23_00720 [Herbiconiux sp. L3-i23]
MRARGARRGAVAAGALLLVGVLAGCGPGGSPSSSAESATPSAVPLEGDRDGDGQLSEFEKQVLARNAPREVALADGTAATVTPGEPLPQPVTDQIVAEALPAVAEVSSIDEFESFDGRKKLRALADRYAALLSRSVVIVYPDRSDYWNWEVSSDAGDVAVTGISGTKDRDATVAAAAEWVESEDAYLIVVG